MKLKYALIAACCGTAAQSASAQSSVQIFGVLDAGVRYVKNGDNSQTQLVSGGINTSRIGFRGTEDLGGGYRAQFWLESQVNTDAGTTAAKFWHRRSTLSLFSPYGEIRLGRDFAPAYRVIQNTDAFGDIGIGAGSGAYATTAIDGQAYATHTRLDNAVAYFTPESRQGFYGGATLAPGEGAPGNRLAGAFVGYKRNALNVLGGYSETEVVDGKIKHKSIGAVYDFGFARLMGHVSEYQLEEAKERHLAIGTIIPMGPHTVRAQYVLTKGRGGAYEADGEKDKTNKFAIGYVYDLSKRTSVYVNAAYLKNDGGATYVVAAGPTLDGGEKSRAIDAGIKHSF